MPKQKINATKNKSIKIKENNIFANKKCDLLRN